MVNLKAKPYYLSDEDIAWVENTLIQIPEHHSDGSHHGDIGCQGYPLADHIPGNILFTFFDCTNQSFVDHHKYPSLKS